MPNRLFLAFLAALSTASVAAVMALQPGETGTLTCAGDALVITQTVATQADYACVAYTPTATPAPLPTVTDTPTATPAPLPTVTDTPTATPQPTPTATPAVQAGAFLDTFDGDPAHPAAFTSPQWDVTVHSRDKETFYTLQSMAAAHGPNCEPPPATHTISAYTDAVYQCKQHIMTAINAGGYGVIYLTPNQQVDFTNGTATVRFDMSTLRTSHRDWIDLYISPMQDSLQLPLEDWLPDLSGQPKNALHLRMDVFNGITPFRGYVFRDHNTTELDSAWWVGYEDVLTPSATVRTTFELQISRTHVKFGIPAYDLWWIDTDMAPLDWTVGVVQFGHHSYNPTKDCDIGGGCTPNTWHWDNVSIDPAVPFTMIHADRGFADAGADTLAFDAPAGANAHLRFAGVGNNLQVSFDNGATWQAAQVQDQVKYTEGAFWSYWTPIPAGAQTVRFRGQPWWGGGWLVRDASVWE